MGRAEAVGDPAQGFGVTGRDGFLQLRATIARTKDRAQSHPTAVRRGLLGSGTRPDRGRSACLRGGCGSGRRQRTGPARNRPTSGRWPEPRSPAVPVFRWPACGCDADAWTGPPRDRAVGFVCGSAHGRPAVGSHACGHSRIADASRLPRAAPRAVRGHPGAVADTAPIESDSPIPVGRNQNKQAHIAARCKFYDDLSERIEIDGFHQVRWDQDFADESMRSAGIRMHYASAYGLPQGLRLFQPRWQFE